MLTIWDDVIWSIKVITDSRKTAWKTCSFSISTVFADGIAPLGARPSAGTVMTKCASYVHMHTHTQAHTWGFNDRFVDGYITTWYTITLSCPLMPYSMTTQGHNSQDTQHVQLQSSWRIMLFTTGGWITTRAFLHGQSSFLSLQTHQFMAF